MFNAMNQVITPPDSAEELGRAPVTSPDAVAAVVAEAAAARSEWARLPVASRAAMLEAAADSLWSEADDLAGLLAAESGKPLGQAQFEVRASIGLQRGNAAEGRRLGGRVLPTEGNPGTEWDLAYTRREPLGVVAAILPFNFPVELFVEKCAAALVVGNAVVVKLPLDDPLVVERFRAALIDAGVPPAVIAAINGDASVGAALATAPGVDAISLTGSTAAGIAVAEATASRLRKLHLELGGNNACLVRADADLELVAAEVIRGRLMMNGQACSATKRVIVHASRHDELVERLRAALAEQRLGPATDPETTVGPLVTPAAAERVAAQVGRASEQGAELLAGDGRANGAYLAPCLLGSVPAAADVAHDDEIFGPVINPGPGRRRRAGDRPRQRLVLWPDGERLLRGPTAGAGARGADRSGRRRHQWHRQLPAAGDPVRGSEALRPGPRGTRVHDRGALARESIVLRRFRQPGEGR